jgi:hypothetical protein
VKTGGVWTVGVKLASIAWLHVGEGSAFVQDEVLYIESGGRRKKQISQDV